MSVYTSIEQDELVEFLQRYDSGELESFQGISAGIENTNYFVNTDRGQYVLTIFEQLGFDELPYFLDIMAFLAEHDVPSAHPVADREGNYLQTLKDKPAALVARLEGGMVDQPNLEQVSGLGETLGHLHAEGQTFDGKRDNPRGPHWWRVTAEAVEPKMADQERRQLHAEIEFQATNRHSDLPRGIIHADLFRDNALWSGNKLTGIIDFYYACNDVLLYDVAVTSNDWCSNPDGSLDEQKTRAFLDHYNRVRPFTDEEKRAWPVMLRAAALRFWLSRLYDLHFPRPGEMTHTHDPDVFRDILSDRIDNAVSYCNYWV